jgi:hypothetical protein
LREGFVPQAIQLFQRQDYSNRELVIVDDSSDPVGNLVPLDPAICYVRREGAQTSRRCIGHKGK